MNMQSTDTLSVEKWVDTETHDVPVVVYQLSSAAAEQTAIRLREELPDEFEPSDLGFHQQYCPEGWRVENDRIVFESQLGPEEELLTAVGVRTETEDRLQSFLTRPTVEIASGAPDSDQNWGTISEDLVAFSTPDGRAQSASVATTDGGEAATAEQSTGADATDDGEQATVASEQAGPGDIDSAVLESDNAEADTGSASSHHGEGTDQAGNPVGRFIDELDGDSLSADQRETLREELDIESVGSIEARIDYCQSELSELTAYVEALETFLDEEGGGQALISEFRDDVATVEAELSELDSRLEAATDGQDGLRERVDEIEDEVDSLTDLADDVSALETELEQTTTALREDIESLRGSVTAMREWQETVTSAFESVRSEMSS